MKLNINKNILSDIVNIKMKVFSPINKFSSKNEVVSICKKFETENKEFFPLPIVFPITTQEKKKINKNKKIKIYYLNNFIATIEIVEIYQIEKIIINKIFGFYKQSHPGIKNFININFFYLDCKIISFNKEILNKIKFYNPLVIKKKIKNKTCAGFHTRNVPHNGHLWIHSFGKKFCQKLLIQPMVGQYKKDEFNEKALVDTNKIATELDKYKSIFSTFFSYPKYCGPREAILHALVRKNYGCSHFLVGRDHAGYKNFYKKYASQKLCKKYEKKIGIKILIFNEPFICKNCKIVTNQKCQKCRKTKKILISGTNIRKLIINNKKIPDYFMNQKIYNVINKDSLIN